MTGTLLQDLCAFVIVCHLILVRLRNVSGKICRENKKKIMFNKFSENHIIYEIIWKNMVELDKAHVPISCGPYRLEKHAQNV
jgi:hypothetical protein